MRQHPIPHNILDIEFKLFGKFTAKQSAYIAIGAVVGGLFLILNANGQVPSILAWPLFIVFLGTGLFLGIVPINDQPADQFISSYFKAISRPTRRVWRNKQFDEKLNSLIQEQGVDVTQGSLDRSQQNQQQSQIIGGGPASVQSFNNPGELSALDSEEQAKLEHIEQLAKQAQTGVQVQQQPAMKPTNPTPPQDTNTVMTIREEAVPTLPKAAPINLELLPNAPYLQVLDSTNHPVSQTLILIKSQQGMVVQAHQTNANGYIVPTRPLESGEYTIEVQNEQHKFPVIKYVANNKAIPPILVKPMP